MTLPIGIATESARRAVHRYEVTVPSTEYWQAQVFEIKVIQCFEGVKRGSYQFIEEICKDLVKIRVFSGTFIRTRQLKAVFSVYKG